MSSYLDKTGLTYLWGKIKSVFAQKGDAVKNIERNGTTFTATKADGTTFTFDQQDTTEATKLKNAKTFNVGGNATGTAQQFDGTQNVSIPITSYNTQGLARPSGIRGVNDNTLQALFNTTRANRLAFLPADQIIIEKTTDGGVTWVDAGVSDSTKLGLFSETRNAVQIPQIDGVRNPLCGIRITFTAMKYNVPENTPETEKYNYWNSAYVNSAERYNQLKDFYFWVSAVDGSIKLKIEGATGAASTTWATVFDNPSYYLTGNSGSDYVRISQALFGGSVLQVNNKYWNYRMTFMSGGKNGTDDFDTGSKTLIQSIMEIRGYGDSWWTAGNTYASLDRIYSQDMNKNVTFPAKVTATSFAGATATGSVSGLMSSSDKTKLDALPTSASLVASLNTKIDKVSGKGLSTNDFTSAYKAKLDGLDDAYEGKMYFSQSGPVVSFSDGADGKLINELVVGIDPVQEGSGDPSPSNVRPISGWTGAKVTRCGKNLIPNTKRTVNAANVMLGQTPSYTQGWEIHLAPGTYILSSVTTKACYLRYINSDGTVSGNSSAGENPAMRFTVTQEDDFAFWAYNSAGIVPEDIVSFQLEFGSSASEYEPYQGEIHDIPFPSEAGTVYGGVLDLTAGTLTVDRAMVDLGTLTWTHKATNYNFVSTYDTGAMTPETIYVVPDAISSAYPVLSYINGNSTDKSLTIIFSTSAYVGQIWVHDSSYSDAATFKAAVSGVQVVYRLATPITYQLTPVEIMMLLGINTVWADCGDILNLEYINRSGWKLLKGVENEPATTSKAGLMSAEDKEKLDSITPLRMNNGVLEYFDGSAWTAVPLGQ